MRLPAASGAGCDGVRSKAADTSEGTGTKRPDRPQVRPGLPCLLAHRACSIRRSGLTGGLKRHFQNTSAAVEIRFRRGSKAWLHPTGWRSPWREESGGKPRALQDAGARTEPLGPGARFVSRSGSWILSRRERESRRMSSVDRMHVRPVPRPGTLQRHRSADVRHFQLQPIESGGYFGDQDAAVAA